MESIGQRIRARRRALKLTQDALARQVGVTRSAVSQMESGTTHDPRPAHLLRYARALRIGVDELVHGGAPAAPPQAREPAAPYGELLPDERGLLEYIRSKAGGDAAQRAHLARVALQLLLVSGTHAVPDEKLGPQWNAAQRRPR